MDSTRFPALLGGRIVVGFGAGGGVAITAAGASCSGLPANRLGRLGTWLCRLSIMFTCGHIYKATQPLVNLVYFLCCFAVGFEFLCGAPIDNTVSKGRTLRQ